MTKLEDLLYSLTTLLIRYHDSQSVETKLIMENDRDLRKKKSRAYAIDLLRNKQTAFQDINKIIKEFSLAYPKRAPFLFYILHEINFLNALHTTKFPFEAQQLDLIKQALLQLFIDFRSLLNTYKSDTYAVRYSNIQKSDKVNDKASVSLMGLKSDPHSYFDKELCASGALLTEEVLSSLNMKATHTDEDLKLIAEGVCTELQNALLAKQLAETCQSLTEMVAAKDAQIIVLQSALQISQNQLTDEQIKSQKLEADKSHLSKEIIKYRNTMPRVYSALHGGVVYQPSLFPISSLTPNPVRNDDLAKLPENSIQSDTNQ